LGTDLTATYYYDQLRSCLGSGEATFAAAKRCFQQWVMFDLGWVRIANPEAVIAEGKIVAVEARTAGLWTLNVSRIVETIDSPTQFGFVYSTTERHVEQGEERFLIEMDSAERVWYFLEAVSRPRQIRARLGLPITRVYQHRFAQDSHGRMLAALSPNSLSHSKSPGD
jgi:uncharacterized protein (UPF0548 family)